MDAVLLAGKEVPMFIRTEVVLSLI